MKRPDDSKRHAALLPVLIGLAGTTSSLTFAQNIPAQTVPPAKSVPKPAPQNPPANALRPLVGDEAIINAEDIAFDGNKLSAYHATIVIGEYTLTGGQVTGEMNNELVFTDSPTLTYRGQTLVGDTIRFTPRTKAYKIENISTALTPDFLRGQTTSPLYVSSGTLFGRRRGPVYGTDIDATTCDKLTPDYLLRAREVKIEPGKRVILKNTTFILYGKRLFTIPTLIIPLDRNPRRPRADYVPQFGRSQDEGYFVKSAFNYLLADRAPGIYRIDAMEKKGLGLGVEQDWNLLKSVGAFALYAIPTSGFGRNLSVRQDTRQNLGGGETISLNNDFQRNSYLSLQDTTTLGTRFGFNRSVQGITTALNLSRQATDSQGSSTRSYTGGLAQSFQFGLSSSISFNADYSRYSSFFRVGDTGSGQRSEQLTTRLQADTRASNYALSLTANKNVPIGSNTSSSFFSGVEKLPELTLSSFRFTNGSLSRLPATFQMQFGSYTEGGYSTLSSTPAKTFDERALFGFDLTNQRIRFGPRTELNATGGFQQYLYAQSDAAQYILRDTITLQQRWSRRSGININYSYQEPRGGTPFRFDQLGRFHALNADIGTLDDSRLQFTARVGYDLAQTAFGGVRRPWQTLSANLQARPARWARLRTLASFDPNTGKFISAAQDFRFRGRNDFAFDLVGRFDPQQHKFSNVNGYLNLPLGPWRIIALTQYNGYLNRFESRNFQIVRDLHCLEASLSYIQNPYGFRNDTQIFFTLRIKGLPQTQRFGVGQFGQAIDTGIPEVY